MSRELVDEDDIIAVLNTARTVAVLGAHPERHRAAFYVPEYMFRQGSRIVPVNPRLAGTTLWGETVRASLVDVREPVDVVDVFRRGEDLPAHLDELLGMAPRPRVVWFQSGISNDGVARALIAAGIDVVQDRCMLADHRMLGLGRVGGA